MTPQELDSFLRKCSEAETVFRSTRQPQNTGIGEMKQEEFFHPWSTIEVVRNERFHAVPAHSHDYIEMNYV